VNKIKNSMNPKPIYPALHGLIDYVFAGVQLVAPSALGLTKTATKTYQVLGTGFLAVNALTATSVGITPIIPFKEHQKIDAAFLVGQSLLTFAGFIRKDKKTLGFHLGFLATAVANYVLTDYDAQA
jgi:hypothetical protein